MKRLLEPQRKVQLPSETFHKHEDISNIFNQNQRSSYLKLPGTSKAIISQEVYVLILLEFLLQTPELHVLQISDGVQTGLTGLRLQVWAGEDLEVMLREKQQAAVWMRQCRRETSQSAAVLSITWCFCPSVCLHRRILSNQLPQMYFCCTLTISIIKLMTNSVIIPTCRPTSWKLPCTALGLWWLESRTNALLDPCKYFRRSILKRPADRCVVKRLS